MGPAESIGDILRLDDMRGWPGGSIGVFSSWNCSPGTGYRSSVNLADGGNAFWGQGTPMISWVLQDEDSDGIKDERAAPRRPMDFVILDGATASHNLVFGLLSTAAVILEGFLRWG